MATLVVYADASDGTLRSFDAASYPTARAGPASFIIHDTDTTYSVGQSFSGGVGYFVYEAFYNFDTSIVGALPVSSATLNITVTDNLPANIGAAILEAYAYTWAAPLAYATFVAGASIGAMTLLGSTTSALLACASSAVKPALNTSGLTGVMLSVDTTRTGTAPTANETYSVAFVENAGTSTDPYIAITLNIADGFITSYKQHPKPLLNLRARGLR